MAFSAHNGYLETYIDGGIVGVLFLGLMFLAVGLKIEQETSSGWQLRLILFFGSPSYDCRKFLRIPFWQDESVGFSFFAGCSGSSLDR